MLARSAPFRIFMAMAFTFGRCWGVPRPSSTRLRLFVSTCSDSAEVRSASGLPDQPHALHGQALYKVLASRLQSRLLSCPPLDSWSPGQRSSHTSDIARTQICKPGFGQRKSDEKLECCSRWALTLSLRGFAKGVSITAAIAVEFGEPTPDP